MTSTSLFAGDHEKLFVNLTSDDINRATMAIAMGTKALTKEKVPVTICLSVEGVEHEGGMSALLADDTTVITF